MSRHPAARALPAILLLAAAPASAGGPDAGKIRQAAEQFDAGVSAFKQKDFEGAASHFEAADAAAPAAKALRQAIRARVEAGQGSRAATLAAQALDRYAGDAATAKLARETLEKFEPLLFKVGVSCASPCVLAVGSRSVPGEASTRWTVYLDPGTEQLSASFFGSAASAPRDVEAKAGGSTDLRFEPEEKKKAPVVVPVKKPETPQELPPDPPPEEPKPERKGISPAFFAVSLVATAGVGGATIWSGIDTQKNPGADAVAKACAGKGPECPLYKQGLAKQLRTNVLIGATAGTAALTVLFAIFTNWRGDKKKPAEPVAIVTSGGAVLGAAGGF